MKRSATNLKMFKFEANPTFRKILIEPEFGSLISMKVITKTKIKISQTYKIAHNHFNKVFQNELIFIHILYYTL